IDLCPFPYTTLFRSFTVYLHPHYDGILSRHIQCIYFLGHYLVIVPVYFCAAFLSGQFFIRFLQCSSRFFRFFFPHFFCCLLCTLLRNPWCFRCLRFTLSV